MTSEEREEMRKKRIRDLAISGGLSGAVLGTIGRITAGFNKPSSLVKAALIGSGITGGLSAGTGYVGGAVLGEPQKGEEAPHTIRGIIGGSLAGGAAGATAGSLLGIPKIAEKIKPNVTNKNFLNTAFSNFIGSGGKKSALRGALAGSLGIGAAGAYQGADEGMQMDFIDAMRAKRNTQDLIDLKKLRSYYNV